VKSQSSLSANVPIVAVSRGPEKQRQASQIVGVQVVHWNDPEFE
jgi:hypothetical protein